MKTRSKCARVTRLAFKLRHAKFCPLERLECNVYCEPEQLGADRHIPATVQNDSNGHKVKEHKGEHPHTT